MLTVSIVIPTYRHPGDLAICFDSILGQSRPPLEVTVVDNDLKQTAQAVVQLYEARFREQHIALRYRANRRNSLPVARNLGAELSRGDTVLFWTTISSWKQPTCAKS